MNYSELLSKRILQLTDERKWSIHRVAELSGLPYSTVNKIVLKERANPTVLTVHSIATAFEMNIVEFLDFDEVHSLTAEQLRNMREKAKKKGKR